MLAFCELVNIHKPRSENEATVQSEPRYSKGELNVLMELKQHVKITFPCVFELYECLQTLRNTPILQSS